VSGLPVASGQVVRAYVRGVGGRHRRELAVTVALHALTAGCGLTVPWLLGGLVEDVTQGRNTVTTVVSLILIFLIIQSGLLRLSRYASARLGEKVLAELREQFVGDVLGLPLASVEEADSGDLVTRTTRDVDLLSTTVRYAIPESLIGMSTIVIALGALVLLGPLLAFPCLVAVPVLWAVTRWYLARAREGYLRQAASYSHLTEGLTETVRGARTVEALRLARRRSRRVDDDIARSYAAERYTLGLRTVFLPIVDTAYVLPVVSTVVIGGLLYLHGLVSLAAVTAATLYVQQLLGPVDTLLFWTNELQLGGASLARLLGASQPGGASLARLLGASQPGGASLARLLGASQPAPEARVGRAEAAVDVSVAAPTPANEQPSLVVSGVRFAYRPGQDVLHDVNLEVRPGERLAIVGPSGAGKSTLGRLLAGIYVPRTGAVTIDGVALVDLPLEHLRRQVALVTQEHHVFHGTLRENLLLAKPDATNEVIDSLRAVDAWEWAKELGLEARVGSGGLALSAAQAQQLALARLILADPRTLILDEATSLLNPRAARHLERSLAAVLAGRTVIAIAHRMHTARDADRIAVLEDGHIVELGTHDELVDRGGVYAALWESWHGRSTLRLQ
jgi:ABC-type multidrug transport system fused ATPase/permease subunit